ncbi:MAG: glycogen synthase GlgA [Alphaproteobacteria bacterium]|jgi:starch synthase|nr:glycogen synthase GlgA [Alphaproteobacteria bacterium]
MDIVMVTPECAPVAKVGGLGDVVHGLSRELAVRGHGVAVVLPKYDCLRYDRIEGFGPCGEDLHIPYFDQSISCSVFSGMVDGLQAYFIEPRSHHNFFNRGVYYGHGDDPERFAVFSRAALEFLVKTGRHPDVIHCHDWQTGLVPVLLEEVYRARGLRHPRTCYTLHNVRHQGTVGAHVLGMVGLLPAELMAPDRLLDHRRHDSANVMKGGIVYASAVTTVSPRYAQEIRHTDQGCGLQETLEHHAGKLSGILNGIDTHVWNPEIDPLIARPYTAARLDDKYENKHALRRRLGLSEAFKPIVAVVGRLDRQKGSPLIQYGLGFALANHAQAVLLGAAVEPDIDHEFQALKREIGDSPDCSLTLGYDEELAHLIYAGAEILLVPSAYEPCGLTQMIGLKYGTVPVVREIGGLADTVVDANYADRAFEERTGYVFRNFDAKGLESALWRAIGLWHRHPVYFRQLQVNGMRVDNSWERSGEAYVSLYQTIRAR